MSGLISRGFRARAVFCGAAVLGALVVGGCGDDNGDSGSATENGGETAKIAYLAYTIADYQTAMVKGMESKIGDGTVTTFNANFDPSKQQSQCQDALQSGRYNVIVIAPITPATGVPCLNAAKAADVPVVALEFGIGKDINQIEPELDGVAKQVVTTPNGVATEVAELAKLACADKNPCEVIGEVATANDPITNENFDKIDALPNIEVIQRIPTQYDPSVFVKGLTDALATHPNIDVVFAAADFGAVAAVDPVKAAGKQDEIVILGNGASKPGIDAIKAGTVFGTIGTWPFKMGEEAGTAAVQAVNGESTDPKGVDGLKLNEPALITQDNVEEVTPEW